MGKTNLELTVENDKDFTSLVLEITDIKGLSYYNGQIKDGVHILNIER